MRFLNYETNPQQLVQEILAKTQKQLMEYFELNNLDPIILTS